MLVMVAAAASAWVGYMACKRPGETVFCLSAGALIAAMFILLA